MPETHNINPEYSKNHLRQQSNRFLKFIAYLQIIGIILVVFGHSFHEYPDGEYGTTLVIYRLFYNFRMPLFMFVSGFLMVYTSFGRNNNYPNPIQFIKKKAKRLLIPYLVLTLVTYVPRAMMSGLADDKIELSFTGLIKSLYISNQLPIPFFWFLQASFLLLITIYTIIYISRRKGISASFSYGIILLAFIVAPLFDLPSPEIFGFHSMVRLGMYFALGAIYCEYYQPINRIFPMDSGWAFIISFIAWTGLFFIGEQIWVLYRLASIFGIAMSISLAKLMVKHNLKFLDHLQGTNYIIFLLSWYLNIATQQILSHYVTLPWWVHTVLSLTFGIYIPWLFYKFLIRNSHYKTARLVLFLLGQKTKQHQTLKDSPK